MSDPARRVVVVTGGASGIGRATAQRFASDGFQVAVFDQDAAGAARAAQELTLQGHVACGQAVDVAEASSVEQGVAAVLAEWGRLDVLVNNAGILRDAQLVKWQDGAVADCMSEADFDAVVAVNLKGVFLCGRAVVPAMIQQGGGVILNASSVVGLYGNFGQTNYAATKGAVITLTRSWARELGRHGIRVNAVAPGFIQTGMLESIPEKHRAHLVAHTPLGRIGRPEDIAEAYAWLASDRASFVTGTVLSVDGGVVLGT